MTLNAGTKLGAYQIQSAIGAGGMGEVYRARDLRLRRDVAIKVLPASFASDPERLRRFEQEATAAAALNHPNILAVYQMGNYEGAPDEATAQRVGERHGKPTILKVDALNMHRQCFKFFLADKGVWLIDQVPPEFLIVAHPPAEDR